MQPRGAIPVPDVAPVRVGDGHSQPARQCRGVRQSSEPPVATMSINSAASLELQRALGPWQDQRPWDGLRQAEMRALLDSQAGTSVWGEHMRFAATPSCHREDCAEPRGSDLVVPDSVHHDGAAFTDIGTDCTARPSSTAGPSSSPVQAVGSSDRMRLRSAPASVSPVRAQSAGHTSPPPSPLQNRDNHVGSMPVLLCATAAAEPAGTFARGLSLRPRRKGTSAAAQAAEQPGKDQSDRQRRGRRGRSPEASVARDASVRLPLAVARLRSSVGGLAANGPASLRSCPRASSTRVMDKMPILRQRAAQSARSAGQAVAAVQQTRLDARQARCGASRAGTADLRPRRHQSAAAGDARVPLAVSRLQNDADPVPAAIALRSRSALAHITVRSGRHRPAAAQGKRQTIVRVPSTLPPRDEDTEEGIVSSSDSDSDFDNATPSVRRRPSARAAKVCSLL